MIRDMEDIQLVKYLNKEGFGVKYFLSLLFQENLPEPIGYSLMKNGDRITYFSIYNIYYNHNKHKWFLYQE